MFRTAILRSAAAASRTAMRPIPSAAVRRFALGPAPRVTSFVPKTVAWQVRCYASGSSLDKDEVYVRIKQLLSGFDKVRLAGEPRVALRAVTIPFSQAHDADIICPIGQRPWQREFQPSIDHRHPKSSRLLCHESNLTLSRCDRSQRARTLRTTWAWTAWTPWRS